MTEFESLQVENDQNKHENTTYLSSLPLYKSVLMFSPNATTATPGERTSAFRE